jgi:hypothetical protein
MAGSPLAAGERPGFATVADLDRDGKLDIVATHDDDPLLAVYYGDGAGGFTPAVGSPFTTPGRMWEVHIIDMDGDGLRELVGAETNTSDGDILVFPTERYENALPEPERIEVDGGELHFIKPEDLDNDGLIDFVVGFWDTHNAVVLMQQKQ